MSASNVMKTNLDLVDECDTFPYTSNPTAYESITKELYTLTHTTSDGTIIPIGHLLPEVFHQLAKVPVSIKGEMEVNRADRTISVFLAPTEAERSKLVAATCNYWRKNGIFKVLEGWRDELYPIYGPGDELLYSVERAASPLFGVVTYGVHLTAYIHSPTSSYSMKIWVPRRAATKQTYGGMLDNTVAGGTSTGEDAFESLIREAAEEASLPADLVRSKATSHGSVTYIYARDSRAGGETGLLQPECEFVYDLELPSDVTPQPSDGEVDEFYLWSVEEVQEALGRGEFKPNCAMVLLDFFIRRGVLTRDNEEHYDEIKARLHRKLEFPGPHGT